MEVRLYRGGKLEILPWIENGYLLVPSPTSKSGTIRFIMNGREQFSQVLTILNHTRTPLIADERLSYWLESSGEVLVRHNTQYLQDTRMVPKYGVEVASSSSVVEQLPGVYKPFQQGSYPNAIGTTGYHGSIGLLPEWDVLYLTSSARSIWSSVQRDAYSAGRYGIHFRDERTNKPIRFTDYPYLSL
jgi:hypothetical protein